MRQREFHSSCWCIFFTQWFSCCEWHHSLARPFRQDGLHWDRLVYTADVLSTLRQKVVQNPLPKDRHRSHPSQDYGADPAIGKRGAVSAIVAWSHDVDAGERTTVATFSSQISRTNVCNNVNQWLRESQLVRVSSYTNWSGTTLLCALIWTGLRSDLEEENTGCSFLALKSRQRYGSIHPKWTACKNELPLESILPMNVWTCRCTSLQSLFASYPAPHWYHCIFVKSVVDRSIWF